MRDVLTSLASGSVTGTAQTNYVSQYQSLLANVKNDILDAAYNGKTLIGSITGSSGTQSVMSVVRNENGAQYTVATFGGSALYRLNCVHHSDAQ